MFRSARQAHVCRGRRRLATPRDAFRRDCTRALILFCLAVLANSPAEGTRRTSGARQHQLVDRECLALARMLYLPGAVAQPLHRSTGPICHHDQRCGTGLLNLLSRELSAGIEDNEIARQIAALLVPVELDRVYETEHFRIVYTDNIDDADCVYQPAIKHPSARNNDGDTVPLYVWDLGEYLEHSRELFLSYGFRPPRSADGIIAVRIRELNSYGQTWGARTLIEIDNDMLGRSADWVCPYLQITSAHELFHCVQRAYVGIADPEWTEEWIREGTAVWAEDAVYDQTNDYVRGLGIGGARGFMGNPDQTLTNLAYDASLYWKFVTESYGTVQEEPHVGADLMVLLWASWELSDSTDALDATLPVTFRNSVREWTRCNRLKDFGDPFPGCDYREDEDCPHDGGSAYPEFAIPQLPLNPGPAAYYFPESVSAWASDYHEFEIAPEVQTVTVRGVAESGEIWWQILPIKEGQVVDERIEQRPAYSRTLTNDGYEKLLIVVTGMAEGGEYHLSVSAPGAVVMAPNPVIARQSDGRALFFGEGVPFSAVEIYSTDGRRIASLFEQSGSTILPWSCRGEGGRLVPGGLYFWVCRHEDRRPSRGRFVLLR